MLLHYLLAWIILMRNAAFLTFVFSACDVSFFSGFKTFLLIISVGQYHFDVPCYSFLPISCVRCWFTFSKQTLLGNVLCSMLSLLWDIPVTCELDCLELSQAHWCSFNFFNSFFCDLCLLFGIVSVALSSVSLIFSSAISKMLFISSSITLT